MSKVQTTVAAINANIVAYAPAVITAVQAAEMSSASGTDKATAVINAIQQGSANLTLAPQPDVAAIAGLVNLVVTIFNMLGVFKHKTPTA